MDAQRASSIYPNDPKINFLRDKQPHSHHLDQNSQQFWMDSIYEKTSPLNIHLNASRQINQNIHHQNQNRRQPSVHILQSSVPHLISEPIKQKNLISLSNLNQPRAISQELYIQNSRTQTIPQRTGSSIQQRFLIQPRQEKQVTIQSRAVQEMNYVSERPIRRTQTQENQIKITHSQQYYPPMRKFDQNQNRFEDSKIKQQQYQINALQYSRPYFERNYDNSLKRKEVGQEIDPPSGKPYCTLTILAIICLLALIGLILGLVFAFISQSGPYPNGPSNNDVKQTVNKIQGKIQGIGNITINSGSQINGTSFVKEGDEKNLNTGSSQTAFMYRDQPITTSATTFVQPVNTQNDNVNPSEKTNINTSFMYPITAGSSEIDVAYHNQKQNDNLHTLSSTTYVVNSEQHQRTNSEDNH